MQLSDGEKEIFLDLIERVTDDLGNKGCNDYDLSDHLDDVQINKLAREFHEWNGDPQEFDPMRNNRYAVPDYALLTFLAKKVLGLTVR